MGNGPRALLSQASYRSCRDTDACVGLWLRSTDRLVILNFQTRKANDCEGNSWPA